MKAIKQIAVEIRSLELLDVVDFCGASLLVALIFFWLGIGSTSNPPFLNWLNSVPLWMQIIGCAALLLVLVIVNDLKSSRKRKLAQLQGMREIKPCSPLALAAALKTARFCNCLENDDATGANQLLDPFFKCDEFNHPGPIPLITGSYYGERTALHRLASCKWESGNSSYYIFYDAFLAGVAQAGPKETEAERKSQFLNLPCKSKGYTALHYACVSKNDTIAKYLLNEGAVDVHAKSNTGCTPLFKAASQNNVFALQLLLKRGADPNAACNEGKTPLIEACLEGHLDAVQALTNLGYGLDLYHQTRLRVTAMNAVVIKLGSRVLELSLRRRYQSIKAILEACMTWRADGMPSRCAEIEKCLRNDAVTEQVAKDILSVVLIYMD